MNAVKELLMRIRSTFDGTGTTAATKAVGNDLSAANTKASETAKKTGKDVEKVGQQAAQAGEQGAGGMNIMSAATAALNGNFTGTASAIVPLITKINMLKGALTSVSLIAAALALVYTVFSKISEYAGKAAEAVAAFNAKSRADMIDTITRSYEAQAFQMDRIARLRDAALEKLKAENEANKAYELAMNTSNKNSELGKTTDETRRTEIEAKYARKATEIEGKYNSSSEKADYDAMKKNELHDWKRAELKEKEILQNKALLRRAEQSAIDNDADAKKEEDSFITYVPVVESKKKEAEQDRVDAQKLRDKITVLERERQALADNARHLGEMAPSVAKRNAASDIERGNSATSMDRADSDRKRANQEALRPALAELDTEMADLHPKDQNALIAVLKEQLKEEQLTAARVMEYVVYVRDQKKAFNDQLARERNF